MATNPWDLSPTLTRAIDAVINHGTHKHAARALGVDPQIVTDRMKRVRRVMGANSSVIAVIKWDRWKRGEEQ
jgi:hypothetical protein